MNNKIKILFVLPSLASGGMERVASRLINEFIKDENVIVSLVLFSNKENFYTINSTVKIYNIYDDFKLLQLFRFRRHVKTNKPDIIISFGEVYNSFVLLSVIGLNVKTFVSDRTNPLRSFGFINDFLSKVTYKLSYGIIAQTSYAKDILKTKTKHKNIAVIGNPIEINENRTIVEKENIIISVGRLIKSKRHLELLDIYKSIKNYKDWKLIIAGEGPERLNLENFVVKNGLSENVKLIGAVTNIDEWYGKAKIFAFASNSEGFPNVLCEAMSHSLPIITYRFTAGCDDLIENNYNGFIIEDGNCQIYVESLNELINNENLRLKFGRNGFHKVHDFEINKISNDFLNFLKHNHD
jgi:GalNAc-alpha-(1->4)-GalNAc-alpha-(1->3)-diNAcBac-PP-undecaprenol alpha-1,4-N-acetyl-D-galactosaminyltransferase